jgi:hypothetical protein
MKYWKYFFSVHSAFTIFGSFGLYDSIIASISAPVRLLAVIGEHASNFLFKVFKIFYSFLLRHLRYHQHMNF